MQLWKDFNFLLKEGLTYIWFKFYVETWEISSMSSSGTSFLLEKNFKEDKRFKGGATRF